MTTIKFQGKEYKVYRSQRKNKKFKIKFKDTEIHFGAKGYSISPGTKKGDKYCSRSSGIKRKKSYSKTKPTPNELSRLMWKCKGKKSTHL
jgi:hypothetical protein